MKKIENVVKDILKEDEIKEFTDKNGVIHRFGKHKDVLTVTTTPYKYINKIVTNKDLENMYNNIKVSKELSCKKSKSEAYKKLVCTIIPFEDFKELMIHKYKLHGIKYEDTKKLIE